MSTSIKCTKCGAELVEHVDSLADFSTGHGGEAVDFGEHPLRAVCSNDSCGAAFDLTIGATNFHELPSNWKELMDREADGLEVPAGWDKA